MIANTRQLIAIVATTLPSFTDATASPANQKPIATINVATVAKTVTLVLLPA
ncbi:MAG: hypothetical protein ABF248_02775 [Yoonia sp.]